MRLLIYDTEMRTANGYLPRAIAMGACELLGHANVRLSSHADVVADASTGQWDALLAIGGAGADRHVISALMKRPLIRILWTTEDPYERHLLAGVEGAFHHVFSNERLCDGASPRTTHLALAAAEEMHFRPTIGLDSDYDYDLTFVGTAWPNRVASLRRLLQKLPRSLRIHLSLPWNRHLKEPELPGVSVIPQLRHDISDLCDIWNRSRIVLTIGRDFSNAGQESGQTRGSSPPPRVYETALAGGFQIALEGAGMDLASTYGERIPLAMDEEEAAELIKHYLSNAEERIARTREIQQFTLATHTYKQRMEEVLKQIQDCRVSIQPPPVPTSPSPEAHVLHVSHNLLPLRRAGGTEAYIHHLGLSQKHSQPDRKVLAMAPTGIGTLALYEFQRDQMEFLEEIQVGPISSFASSNTNYEKAFCGILTDHDIGIVHVHHLIGLPLSLPMLAKAIGCRLVITLHDFYLACHRYNLLMPDQTFCRVYQRRDYRDLCRYCLMTAGMGGGERSRRLLLTRQIIASADVLIANTPESASILKGIYPEVESRTEVLEMLTPDIDQLLSACQSRIDSGPEQRLRIAVIGNAVAHKGLLTLIGIIRESSGMPYEFHIMGATEELDEALSEASIATDQAPIGSYCGVYEREALIKVLGICDVALFLSVWPETYNISMGEAMAMGVVPVATRLGAHIDRVQDGFNGLLVNEGSVADVVHTLEQLHRQRAWLHQLQQGALKTKLMDSQRHCQNLDVIYQRLAPPAGNSSKYGADQIKLGHQLDLSALNLRLPHGEWNKPGLAWDKPV